MKTLLRSTQSRMLSGERNSIHARTCCPKQMGSSGSIGEPKVFKPYTGVRLPGILGDVGRRPEALWERRSLDASAKGPWSQAIWARAPIVWPATMPGVHFTSPRDGLGGVCVACPHDRPMDVIIMPGSMPVADDTASILVRLEPLAHRRPVWSGR